MDQVLQSALSKISQVASNLGKNVYQPVEDFAAQAFSNFNPQSTPISQPLNFAVPPGKVNLPSVTPPQSTFNAYPQQSFAQTGQNILSSFMQGPVPQNWGSYPAEALSAIAREPILQVPGINPYNLPGKTIGQTVSPVVNNRSAAFSLPALQHYFNPQQLAPTLRQFKSDVDQKLLGFGPNGQYPQLPPNLGFSGELQPLENAVGFYGQQGLQKGGELLNQALPALSGVGDALGQAGKVKLGPSKGLVAANSLASHLADITDAVAGGKITPEIGQLLTDSAKMAAPGQSPESSAAITDLPGKARKFITSVQESPEVSASTKALVSGTYTPKSNQLLKDQSAQLLAGGLDKASTQVLSTLLEPGVQLSDQQVADAITVAKSLDSQNRFNDATQVIDSLAVKLTQAGRSVQAASLLDNRSPQGLRFMATKTLTKAGVKITPSLESSLKALVAGIEATTPQTPDRSIAVQKLVRFTNQQIPRGKIAASVGWWRAGLLTGPETVAKVGVSHLVQLPFELASQLPAELADRALALVTGQRSFRATSQGLASGFLGGVKALGTKLTSGIDLPGSGGYESDFGAATYQSAYENFIGNLHGGLFKPTYSARYQQSLYDQALTAATNQGLTGAEKSNFVSAFVAKPPQAATQLAQADAELVTNQQSTTVGQLAAQLQNFAPGGLPIGKILTPFTRIPSAIGVNGLWNYTPFGLGSEVVKAIGGGTFNQRVLSQAIGRAATGTTVAALGALLGSAGLMTLNAPADPKERALWQLQGKNPNSVNFNGHWLSLNALGPVGLVLGIGGAFGQQLARNGGDVVGAIPAALASGGRLLLDQPYLKGLSGVSKALNDPTRQGEILFENTAGSVIPALLQQIARGSDNATRMFPQGLGAKFKSELPFLRGQQPVQRDLYGQVVPGLNPETSLLGGVAGTVNPFYPAKAKTDPVTSELQRLYNAVGSGPSPNIGALGPKQTIYGLPVKLTNQQLSDFTAQIGPLIQAALTKVIADPNYQGLNDWQKAKVLETVIANLKGSDYQLNNIGSKTTSKTPPGSSDSSLGKTASPATPSPSTPVLSGAEISGNNLATGLPGSSGPLVPSTNNTPLLDKYQLQMAKDRLINSNANVLELGSGRYLIKDQQTGAIKLIDNSSPVVAPQLTGGQALDAVAITKYNAALSNRINAIYQLYQAGKLTQDQANSQIAGLKSQSLRMDQVGNVHPLASRSSGRKKQILGPKVPKRAPRFKVTKAPRLKAVKLTQLKLASQAKVKLAPKVSLSVKA